MYITNLIVSVCVGTFFFLIYDFAREVDYFAWQVAYFAWEVAFLTGKSPIWPGKWTILPEKWPILLFKLTILHALFHFEMGFLMCAKRSCELYHPFQ